MNYLKKTQELLSGLNKLALKKEIVIFLFLVITSTSFAQKEPVSEVDKMLSPISKTTVIPKVLYDRVSPFAKLAVFNDSINISNTAHFEQALNELYKASSKEQFLSYKELRTSYSKKTAYNKVDIGVINSNFQQLNYQKNNEQKGGLKIINNQFQKQNNDKPLFIAKEALIIAPLKEFLIGNRIVYHFDRRFLLEDNAVQKIKSITANFGTKQNYTLYNNGSLINNTTVSYTKTGYKTLTFTVIFTNGVIKKTKAIIHVKTEQNLQQRSQSSSNIVKQPDWKSSYSPNPSDFKFKGYDNPNETTPINGELEWTIFYANNNAQKKILKPFIVIDGFDPLDTRKIQDSDPHPTSTDEDHVSIEETMYYINSNGSKEDIIELLNAPPHNYDVIIINQPTYTRNDKEIDGGADYIERNGLTHASLYQEINRQLSVNNSSEELVILGPSMGGLISRYALAFMEKKYAQTGDTKWQHNCRLWVSVDSPHLGANIPIGVQSSLNQLKDDDNVKAEDFVEKRLESTAAKQLLIEQFNGFNGTQVKEDYLNAQTVSQGFSSNRGHPYFIKFYNNLYTNGISNSKGYPQNLRKIALTNGSLSGSKAYYNLATEKNDSFLNNGQIATNIRGFQYICVGFWGICIENIPVHIASIESYGMPAYNQNHKISRYKSGFSDNDKFITNKNSRGNMDNVPGGYFPVFSAVTDGVDGTSVFPWPTGTFKSWGNFESSILAFFSDLLGGSSFYLYNNEYVSSFIASPSALGFKNPNFQWDQPINTDLVCSNQTPFDSYFGENKNTEHVTFTVISKNWLFEELAGNKQSPPVPSRYISGNFNPTEGSFEQYSVPSISGASYNWSIESIGFGTSGWSIYGSGNSVSVEVGNNPVKIVCNVTNGCPNFADYINLYPKNSDDGDCGEEIFFSSNPMKSNDLNNRISLMLPEPCFMYRSSFSTKSENSEYTISIHNIYGERVYFKTQKSTEFSMNTLKKGFYIVEFQNKKGKIISKTLVIE